jgi:hypothetical protein
MWCLREGCRGNTRTSICTMAVQKVLELLAQTPFKIICRPLVIRRALLDFLDPAVVCFVLFSIRQLFNLKRASAIKKSFRCEQ